MKLTLRLEWPPADSALVEIDLTPEDLRGDQVEVFERIKQAWASVRERYGRTG